MAHRILVVDDDPHIRDIICFALRKDGMIVTTARNGVEALACLAFGPADLVVLDIGMPEMDGLEVCRRMRGTSDTPILFLSARDEEIDRVLGLEIGGDDYVTKPFSPRELVARIKVILRRAGQTPPAPVPAGTRHGGLWLDPEAHAASFQGQALTLTALEFAILKTLLSRPTMVFNRDQILNAAYGVGMHVSDRTIDSHVRNIRAKLATAGCAQGIETVHGVGFRIGRCEARG
jgi:two-component system OmpR family response regulator